VVGVITNHLRAKIVKLGWSKEEFKWSVITPTTGPNSHLLSVI
jgi:hypothetical protein